MCPYSQASHIYSMSFIKTAATTWSIYWYLHRIPYVSHGEETSVFIYIVNFRQI